MKFILFCNLPYAFSILYPIAKEINTNEDKYLWYVPPRIRTDFPYTTESNITSNLQDLIAFHADAVFVPGNDVPYFIDGIKIQIFHGLAGEKKGHFRIRDHFDIYLTQGPYFTNRFLELCAKYKNFSVIETGWCKLDPLYTTTSSTLEYKKNLLENYNAKKILLYAPTFSPSLTSGEIMLKYIDKIASIKDMLIIIKFHDKMDKTIMSKYHDIALSNILISQKQDIIQLLQIADIMLSDTSSVVYEFLLLNKPVITINTKANDIAWTNITDPTHLISNVTEILDGKDNYQQSRRKLIASYHPYSDGKSAQRVLQSTKEYLQNKTTTNKKRKLSIFKKLKIYLKYRT